MTATEIVEAQVVHDDQSLLFAAASPDQSMELAARTAEAVKRVIDSQGLSMRIGQSEHVLNTGWQMAANTQRVVTDRDEGVIELAWPPHLVAAIEADAAHTLADGYRAGLAFGYRASFFAKRDGQTVGWGEARCDRTERNWKRSENNAIASMAQTRAQSKALRQPLAWVIGLAGYSPTPAEEMPQEPAGEPTAPLAVREASDEQEADAILNLRKLVPDIYSIQNYLRLLRRAFAGTLPETAARTLIGLGHWVDAEEKRLQAEQSSTPDPEE